MKIIKPIAEVVPGLTHAQLEAGKVYRSRSSGSYYMKLSNGDVASLTNGAVYKESYMQGVIFVAVEAELVVKA